MKDTSTKAAIIAVLLTLTLTSHVFAEDIFVPSQYSTIQSAIDIAVDGDVITVEIGTYNENINFLGKNITLTSTAPDDLSVVESTVIQGDGATSVVTFADNETSLAVLKGLTITGGVSGTLNDTLGENVNWGAGIYCFQASPTITDNLLTGNNSSSNVYGGAIGCIESDALIERNIFTNNSTFAGGGILVYAGNPKIWNNIFYSNTADYGGGVCLLGGGHVTNNTFASNIANEGGAHAYLSGVCTASNNIMANAPGGSGVLIESNDAAFTNNNIWSNSPGNYARDDMTGTDGNISEDPLFVDAATNDFHVFPGSPCIDAGTNTPAGELPDFDFSGQDRPIDGDFNGEALVDIGAYESEGPTAPVISASVNSLSFFGFENGDNPAPQILTIYNSGIDTLNWTIQEDCQWLEITPLTGSSTGQENEVNVSVDVSVLTPGKYNCTFEILSAEAVNAPKTIAIYLNIAAEGELVVPDMYPTIQQAIDNAVDGDSVIVMQGTYNEDINLSGKNILITSINPDDSDIVSTTTIWGTGSGTTVTFLGTETSSCKIEGLKITGGTDGGIFGNGTGAQISKCIISGNNKDGAGGGILKVNGAITYCTITNNTAPYGGGIAKSHGTIRNCIIAGNSGEFIGAINNCDGDIINCTIVNNTTYPGGIGDVSGCDGVILNCIIWGNSNSIIVNCTAQVSYCCLPFDYGQFSITADPKLTYDYHLASDSLCINSGDPDMVITPGTLDMDGQDRVMSWQIDIGADEFQGYVKPRAFAGPDQTYLDIPSVITLEGVAYTEPTAVLGYLWQQVSGPEVSLSDDTAAIATFEPSVIGVYVFELTVSDEVSQSEPDQVGIVVGNHTPIAEAGLTVYASIGDATLDGSASYDRDGYGILTYQWQQISGTPLTIVNPQLAKPTVRGFAQEAAIQRFEFELVASDGLLFSRPDTVELVVLPTFQDDTLYQVNPPFDPSKPTMIGFGGGNCNTGGSLGFSSGFQANANILTVTSYKQPYTLYGDLIIDYLYRMAPNYDQPIQTAGFSTGNMPAIDVGIHINTSYNDPRYAINRVTLLDAGCRNYTSSISSFLDSKVDDEPCWIENYHSHYGQHANTLNIRFPLPPATHGTPVNWFYDSTNFSDSWPFDVYNTGIVAGEFISVAGPAKNLDMTSTNSYYFSMIGDYNAGDPGYLEFYNEQNYPDKLLQPIRLSGPADGATVGAEGAVLSSLACVNAVSYQLIFGPDPRQMDHIISETSLPPTQTIKQFPFETTYWTVKATDKNGNTIFADPIRIHPDEVYEPVENIDLGKRYPYIQLAINEAEDGEQIIVEPGIYRESLNLQGRNLILSSSDPDDASIVGTTVIIGNKTEPVITFAGTETQDCFITGFTITGGNGGIAGYRTHANISRCVITENVKDGSGGGIHRVNGDIYACKIINNEGVGGGLAGCNGTISNCLIADNIGDVSGMKNCDGNIVNCTITANNLNDGGTGVLSDCDGSIVNCIIKTNSSDVLYNCNATISNTCMEGGGDNGNIDVDPLFVLSEDYHLLPASLCIDAGTDTPSGGLSANDIDGNIRNIDGNGDSSAAPDMGAYEYDGQNPCIVVSPKKLEFYISEITPVPESQDLAISNCGGSILNWQIDEDCNWLSVNPAAGQSAGESQSALVSIQPQSLTKGIYQYTVIVRSDNAVNGDQICHVILYVNNNTLNVPDEYGSIQHAIDASLENNIVFVAPGVYQENIDFRGKNITVTSTDPDTPSIVDSTVIHGSGLKPVVTFEGTENQDCLLTGFTITGGFGGIAGNGTNANVSRCVIAENIKDGPGGGMQAVNGDIYACKIINNEGVGGGGLAGCNGTIRNCLVAGNTGDVSGLKNCDGDIVNCTITANILTSGGTSVLRGCDGSITNCIIKANSSDVLDNCIATISFTCMEDGVDNGNIDADPLFANAGQGDYHLKSEGWHWDLTNDEWAWDDITCRCIDAGNPGFDLADELLIVPVDPLGRFGENVRINMGAYGGTSEASIPPYHWTLLCDLNNNGIVAMDDFALLANQWLTSEQNLSGDVNRNGTVEVTDLTNMASQWLETVDWY